MTSTSDDSRDGTSTPGPQDISPAAATLLAAMAEMPVPEITAEGLPERRRKLAGLYEPRISRAKLRYDPLIRDVEISGIPCLEIVSAAKATAGTILYLFGGAHISGEPIQDLPITAPLASHSGARVIAPSLRLAPEDPWPASLDDALTVYRALVGSPDVGPVAVVGESAGGNLALCMLLKASREQITMPAAAVLLSPWCDLSNPGPPLGDSFDPSLADAYLDAAARLYAGSEPLTHPEISPIYGTFEADFPPTMITSGTRDRLVRDCKRLAERLQASGISVEMIVWRGMWHVFEFYDEVPEAEQSLKRIASFISQRLAG
jgi:monoterpene epsilon-lactone hydrolase